MMNKSSSRPGRGPSSLRRVAAKTQPPTLLSRAKSSAGVRGLADRISSPGSHAKQLDKGAAALDDAFSANASSHVLQEMQRELAALKAHAAALEVEVRQLRARAVEDEDEPAKPFRAREGHRPSSDTQDETSGPEPQKTSQGLVKEKAAWTADMERKLVIASEEIDRTCQALRHRIEGAEKAELQLPEGWRVASPAEAPVDETAQMTISQQMPSDSQHETVAKLVDKGYSLMDIEMELEKAQVELQCARREIEMERKARLQAEENATDLQSQLVEVTAEAEVRHAENQRAMQSFKAKLAAMQKRSQEAWEGVQQKRGNVDQLRHQIKTAKAMQAKQNPGNA